MTARQHRLRLERARARRARLVKSGLRSDGKPRAQRKPCGCLAGHCHLCRRPGNKRIISLTEVKRMHRVYMTGVSLGELSRRFLNRKGTTYARSEIKRMFKLRGLFVRPYLKHYARNVNGTFIADPPKTAAQINLMISGLKRIAVPCQLKREWRLWPLTRRAWFIKKVRAHLVRKFCMKFAPTGPHSSNVQPFDYTTPAAREIVARLNAGRNSQLKVACLKPSSQGMIYKGRLFFWLNDCYGRMSHPYAGTNLLHREIYERHYGPIPAGMTVIHRDGNKNNLSPGNLGLRSMEDCARMNAWHRRPEQFPDLMKKASVKAWITRDRNLAAQARVKTTLLLANFNAGGTSIITKLRRKNDHQHE